MTVSGQGVLSFNDVSQEKSARYTAVEPSSGSNVIPRRARPSLAGVRPHGGDLDDSDDVLEAARELLDRPEVPRS